MNKGLETEILEWIDEEGGNDGHQLTTVPVQLLIVRLAVANRGDEQLTQSTELSLDTFERADLYRILRQLVRKEFLQFVRQDGSTLDEEEGRDLQTKLEEDRALGYVTLTKKGRLELQRIQRVAARPE